MPQEDLLLVQFHESLNRLVNLLLEEDRVVALVPPGQLRLDRIGEVGGSQKPLVGAQGLVVDLADLGPDPLLIDKFDGRQEIIQEGAQGAVDAGEGLVFGRGVEAAVADIIANTFKVFLFDETVVVFLVGPVRVKEIRRESHQDRRVRLINSEPLSLSMPRRGKGRLDWMSGRASMTHFWALLRRGRSSTHPEATSVASKVRQNSPASRSPQWWTVSISKNPGFRSFQG